MAAQTISLDGVRENNLKDLRLELPRHVIVAVVGVSGSGKSSLLFSTIVAESVARHEALTTTAARRGFARRPRADRITGLIAHRCQPPMRLTKEWQRGGGTGAAEGEAMPTLAPDERCWSLLKSAETLERLALNNIDESDPKHASSRARVVHDKAQGVQPPGGRNRR